MPANTASIYYAESNMFVVPKKKSYIIAADRDEAIAKFCTNFQVHPADLDRVTCIVDNERVLL
jgi:hypothetical protein